MVPARMKNVKEADLSNSIVYLVGSGMIPEKRCQQQKLTIR